MKYASVQRYNDVVLVHMRNYYFDGRDRSMPTKNGIALTSDQWKQLKKQVWLHSRPLEIVALALTQLYCACALCVRSYLI